jgi:hypothetical protein
MEWGISDVSIELKIVLIGYILFFIVAIINVK